MSKKMLIKRLSRNNGNEQEASDFLDALSLDDIIDLEIELLGDF